MFHILVVEDEIFNHVDNDDDDEFDGVIFVDDLGCKIVVFVELAAFHVDVEMIKKLRDALKLGRSINFACSEPAGG